MCVPEVEPLVFSYNSIQIEWLSLISVQVMFLVEINETATRRERNALHEESCQNDWKSKTIIDDERSISTNCRNVTLTSEIAQSATRFASPNQGSCTSSIENHFLSQACRYALGFIIVFSRGERPGCSSFPKKVETPATQAEGFQDIVQPSVVTPN